MAEQHFGGFMKKKEPEDEKKTWKERMEEMIGESKKKKVKLCLIIFGSIKESLLEWNFLKNLVSQVCSMARTLDL